MTTKTFIVAGVSNLGGQWKVRYANSLKRKQVLEQNGHTGVVLWQFAEPLRKQDLVDALLNIQDISPDAREAIKSEARTLGFIV